MDRYEKAYEIYRQQKANDPPAPHERGDMYVSAVRKSDDGDLIAFKTNTGEELDYIQALEAAKSGKLSGIDIFHKYGRDIIRSEPDGIKENNLDHLPEF
ncbi:DUF3892 domain-containing protein [Guptibacillus algicola]|uniref:DUF3892 domain-containing protein n=1 Tax=Guptibacillus algicola TaxID=225844 RepID=UPI001CD3E098|nr:DUF3892 domain-containing protein [Alkalihalobacillus algicola]MCA0987872.1 DUF3892 domain-containing protein [Alkalihalobacillus algicola]